MHSVISQHVESRPEVCGGKPCVIGTRIRVQDIYVWHELQGRTPDEIVSRYPQLTLADVHAALAYYWDHRDEVDQQIRESDELLEMMKRSHPSKLQQKLAGAQASRDQVSS
jgi:uncharacterized protein (DUF433 family)